MNAASFKGPQLIPAYLGLDLNGLLEYPFCVKLSPKDVESIRSESYGLYEGAGLLLSMMDMNRCYWTISKLTANSSRQSIVYSKWDELSI